MNFNFIKRKFDIKMVVIYGLASLLRRMSILLLSIKFSGSIDLVNDQLTGSTDARNTYKQKIPFETELKMKGDLMEPSITFDIVLPDGNSVSAEVINTTQATNAIAPATY
jgi:hypothetical protein